MSSKTLLDYMLSPNNWTEAEQAVTLNTGFQHFKSLSQRNPYSHYHQLQVSASFYVHSVLPIQCRVGGEGEVVIFSCWYAGNLQAQIWFEPLLSCFYTARFQAFGKGRLLRREATPIPNLGFLPGFCFGSRAIFRLGFLGFGALWDAKSLRICESS